MFLRSRMTQHIMQDADNVRYDLQTAINTFGGKRYSSSFKPNALITFCTVSNDGFPVEECAL